MKSRGAVIISLSARARTNVRGMRNAGAGKHTLRGAFCGIFILVALACATLTTPSAAGFRGSSPVNQPDSAANESGAAIGSALALAGLSEAQPPSLPGAGAAGLFTSFMPQALPVLETIDTYAADCTTPKEIFNLGETICAKFDGAPIYQLFALRRIVWANTGGLILQQSDVNVVSGNAMFTLPTTATAADGLDRRGGWSVNSISTSDGSVRVQARFTVRDPNNAAANLSVYESAESSVGAGGDIDYLVAVGNRGPDAAQNVQLNVDAPTLSTTPNSPLSFVSKAQLSGPAFTCASDSTCTIASLPVGAVATFRFSYSVPAGTASYTVITDTANVSSSTTDPSTSNNSTIAYATVIGTETAPECTLACPNDMVVTADTTNDPDGPGGAEPIPGAIVTFSAAEPFGTCGTVTSSPASGTFFPVGATVVSSTASGGGSCSFTVTVVNDAGPTISCPANVTEETDDCSATVAISTPTTAGGTGAVSVASERSDNLALDDPFPIGTTTITWTATDSAGRIASCAQTVTVSSTDTTPPTITAPDDLTFSTGASGGSCGLIVAESELGEAEAADNGCSVSVTRTGLPTGNFFPVGTTTITWKATDAAGNTATDTQTITIIEDTPPTVILADLAPVSVGSSCTVPVPDVVPVQGNLNTGEISDNCTPYAQLTPPVQNPPAGTLVGPGSHTITVTTTDALGNVGTGTVIFEVVDDTLPTITAPDDVQASTDATSCTASNVALGTPQFGDNCTGAQVTNDAPAVFPVGTTTVTWTVTDAAGNTATDTQLVTVSDQTGPVITPTGSNPLTVECHTSFTDPGASASDACDGARPVSSSNDVNVDVPGTYTVTYTATDTKGNPSTATRTVNVVDTTAPVISLNGASAMTVECHTSFTDPGASASDSCDTSVPVTASGNVDVNVPDTYTITYNAADDSGNAAAPVTRTVTVVDTTKPVITLNGNAVVTVECQTSYTDAGASAADSCDASVPVVTSGSVNVNVPSTYTITYTATDDSGNTQTATRTVNVVDTTLPTITVLGANPATVIQGDPYTDAGATADDSCAGGLTVTTTGTVNTGVIGTYTLTYTATDPSGNTATATRTVNVIYRFTGFFSPIGNLPTLNSVNAGRTLPIKFSLNGDQGLGIMAAGFPASQQVTCNSSAPISELEGTETSGGSTLTYGSGQYHYNWKTEGSWAGTCRLLNVKLIDGTEHTALFKFK